MKLRHLLATACTALTLIVLSNAHAADAGGISIADAFVPLPPPGQSISAAFLKIRNSGPARKLVKAESSAATTVELHTHSNDNGVMRMRQIDAIDVPAKGEAVLQPGGLHIMLIGLKTPLQEGQKVSLKLNFDDGSSKTVDLPVQRGMTPPVDHSQHDHMHHDHQMPMAAPQGK